MRLCQYKDIAGIPGEGVHEHVIGIAAFDVIGTALGAWIISAIGGWSFIVVFIVLLIFGEFLHWLFCVDTAVIKFIKYIFDIFARLWRVSQNNAPTAANGP